MGFDDQTWKCSNLLGDDLIQFGARFSSSQAHGGHPKWLVAWPWCGGSSRRQRRRVEVVVFFPRFLKILRRRSTLLAAPRASLELEEVKGGDDVTGVAMRPEETTFVCTALRNRPTTFVAEPVAGEGCQNSSLVVGCSPTRKVAKTGRHDEATVPKEWVSGKGKERKREKEKKVNEKYLVKINSLFKKN